MPAGISTQFRSYFQVFSPEPPWNLATGSNQGQKWIQHPQNGGAPYCQPPGPTFLDVKASGWGGPTEHAWGATCTHTDRRMHLPWDPTRRPSGHQKLVPGAGNRVAPRSEGVESISGIGLTEFQGFKGILGSKPGNVQNQVKILASAVTIS